MTRSHPFTILILNLLGITLFLSWYLLEHHGFWFKIDSAIFYFFNEKLIPGSTFTEFVAFVNIRLSMPFHFYVWDCCITTLFVNRITMANADYS